MHRPAPCSKPIHRLALAALALAVIATGCTIRAGQVRKREPANSAPAATPSPKPKPAPVSDSVSGSESASVSAPESGPKSESEPDKAKPKKKHERKEAAAAAEPAAKPADPNLRTIALPFRLPLSIVRTEIEKRLPAQLARGWEPVTKSGANPSIDAKITVWRDAVGLRVNGDVIEVELPLRYAAEIRGKAKTPFGKSISLDDGQTWGTKAEPQRLTLRGRARVTVSEAWELGVELDLDEPKHGAAPSGSICTSGSFKLCVPKDTVAPIVREKIDAEITQRFAKLEAAVTDRARKTVELPKRVAALWAMLGCPIPLDEGVKFDCGKRKAPKNATQWLVVNPIAADVSYRGEGDALVVELRVSARFERAVGNVPPRREVGPLPPRGAPAASAEPIELDASFDVEDLRRAVRERVAAGP